MRENLDPIAPRGATARKRSVDELHRDARRAHLHYELIVNGTKVDPMRVRLPNGKILEGDDLLAFKKERERIDQLLVDDGGSLKVASAKLTN